MEWSCAICKDPAPAKVSFVTLGDGSFFCCSKCPGCGNPISRPVEGNVPIMGATGAFTRACPHCKTLLRLWVRWAFEVEAEVDSKTV